MKPSKILPRRELQGVPHKRRRDRVARDGSYMDHVAAMACGVCGAHGVQLHHVREGQGMSQRASDWLVIPLCPDCHTGPSGLHGDRSAFRIRKLSELDVLARVIEASWRKTGGTER